MLAGFPTPSEIPIAVNLNKLSTLEGKVKYLMAFTYKNLDVSKEIETSSMLIGKNLRNIAGEFLWDS